MLSAYEYAFLTPPELGRRGYREVCRHLDLDPIPGGYGALLCCDQDGRRITMLTNDPDYLRMAVEAVRDAHRLRGDGAPIGMPVSAAKFPSCLPWDLVTALCEERVGKAAS